MLCNFIFFQAEDGIRDIGVTGVQTCALPIFSAAVGSSMMRMRALCDSALAISTRWRLPTESPPTSAPGLRSWMSSDEIGRASCRERVEISVVAGSLKKNNCLIPLADVFSSQL